MNIATLTNDWRRESLKDYKLTREDYNARYLGGYTREQKLDILGLKKYMNAKEISKLTGVNTNTVRTWARLSKLWT